MVVAAAALHAPLLLLPLLLMVVAAFFSPPPLERVLVVAAVVVASQAPSSLPLFSPSPLLAAATLRLFFLPLWSGWRHVTFWFPKLPFFFC